jgi:hypothetical protein
MLKEAPTPFSSIGDLNLLPPFEERGQGKRDYTTLREADIVLHVDQCPVYLINRGFSQRALRAYEIGYDTSKSRIVLPIRDVHGDLVGITYRTDFPDGMMFKGRAIKYWHDHFDKSKHLYGFHRLAGKKINRIFLVEGQLDVLRLHQLGHAAVGVMGSTVSDRQMDLLKRHARCSKLILAFDNDDAGKEATRRAAKRLVGSRFGRNMYRAIYPTNDPGELREYHQIKYQHWTKQLMKGSR